MSNGQERPRVVAAVSPREDVVLVILEDGRAFHGFLQAGTVTWNEVDSVPMPEGGYEFWVE